MEWLCLRLVCVFVLLIEGAVDLDLLVSALVLEEVDGGFSSMSVLLPVWPDLVLGPDVNHVYSDRGDTLKSHAHLNPADRTFLFLAHARDDA